MSERTRVAAIVGPTAAGKSAVAVQVAKRLDAEIVSIDSMQLYRDMDAGTAKPTSAQREEVQHHLLDVFPPSHDVTVAEFQSLARAAIEEIAGRGRLPLLVGGSGLYYRAVVDELRFPPRSRSVRRRLEDEASHLGAEALYERLRTSDPLAAARIEPQNVRRIVRALEVMELTGEPFSSNDAWDRYESIYDLRVAGLSRARAVLFERIAARVDDMLGAGLIDEATTLEPSLGVTARQALGYRQVLDAVRHEELRDEIVRATKRFARRQESWFRADPRVAWFDAGRGSVADEIAGYISGDVRARDALSTPDHAVP